MPEVLPSSTEEQEEEEEEKAASSLRLWGLHNRGPAVLTEVESAGQSIVAEGVVVAEQPEEVTERAEVEVLYQLGVSIQPAASSAQERGMEVQQSGSPSILMPTSRLVEPSPTTGVLSGKAPIPEASLCNVPIPWVRRRYYDVYT